MTSMGKGLALAVVHLAIVSSLGAKLVADRAALPRVWVRTAPVDPNLPIRGRYVQMRIEVDATPALASHLVALRVEDGRLVAREADRPSSGQPLSRMARFADGRERFMLARPLAFFIAEHADDPSRRPPDEELWVEVSVPPRGAPRPIRLGVKKDGLLTPLP